MDEGFDVGVDTSDIDTSDVDTSSDLDESGLDDLDYDESDMVDDILEDTYEDDMEDDIPDEIAEDVSEDTYAEEMDDMEDDMPDEIAEDVSEDTYAEEMDDMEDDMPDEIAEDESEDDMGEDSIDDSESMKEIEQIEEVEESNATDGMTEATDNNTAYQNLADYMSEHNYGMEDYDEYSKDPEWQKLHQEAYPEWYKEDASEDIPEDVQEDISNDKKEDIESVETYDEKYNDIGIDEENEGEPVKVLKLGRGDTVISSYDTEQELLNINEGIENAKKTYDDISQEIDEDIERITNDSTLSLDEKVMKLKENREKADGLNEAWKNESEELFQRREELGEELQEQKELDDKSEHQMDDDDTRDMIRDLLEQNVNEQKLPSSSRVEWLDNSIPGEAVCRVRDDAQIKIHDKATNTDIAYNGSEFKKYMLDKYGTDTVSYSHREPDFEPFEQEFSSDRVNEFLQKKYGNSDKNITTSSVGNVYVEQMDTERGGNGTFAKANKEIATRLGISEADVRGFMKENNLTWHECGDRHTIRAVPSEINQAFGHTGGIGLQQDMESLSESMRKTAGDNISLQKESISGTVEGLEDAINSRYEQNKSIKRELFGKK